LSSGCNRMTLFCSVAAELISINCTLDFTA
jgi:hypothetical protein